MDISGEQHDVEAHSSHQRRTFGNRGEVTTRPSRDSIVSSYQAESAARARNARMHSAEAAKSHQANAMRRKEREYQRSILEAQRAEEERKLAQKRQLRRELDQANARTTSSIHEQQAHGNFRSHRVARPLSSLESQQRVQSSRDAFDYEREARDIFSSSRNAARTTNREVIDARGSFDSRAFSEYDRIVSYSINEEDKPVPRVNSTLSKSRWRSHGRESVQKDKRVSRRFDLGSLSDSISGKSVYGKPQQGYSSLPLFARIAIPVLAVLLVVLIYLMFF